jgi:ABC-type uncharacterized transport system permease subunit
MVNLEHAGVYDRRDIKNESVIVGPNADKVLEQASILNIIQRGIALLVGASGTQHTQQRSKAKTEVTRLINRGKIEDAIDKMLSYAEKEQQQSITNQLYMISGRWHRLMQTHHKGTISADELRLQHNMISASLLQLIDALFE